MTQIAEWIKEFGLAITAIFTFAYNAIESLISLFVHLPAYLNTITQAISYIPQVYQSVLLATIGITVIFLITNRGK